MQKPSQKLSFISIHFSNNGQQTVREPLQTADSDSVTVSVLRQINYFIHILLLIFSIVRLKYCLNGICLISAAQNGMNPQVAAQLVQAASMQGQGMLGQGQGMLNQGLGQGVGLLGQ